MALPIAVLAENEGVISGAEDGGRCGVAGVAEEGAGVLCEERVCGVDLAVAGEAQPCSICTAVEEGGGIRAEITEARLGSGGNGGGGWFLFDLGMARRRRIRHFPEVYARI